MLLMRRNYGLNLILRIDLSKIFIRCGIQKFLAIEDSLLINLYYSNKNYFKIPAAKTRMKKDVYFCLIS